MEQNTTDINEQLLKIWEEIGKRNYWIRGAVDPSFDKTMLTECNSLEELENNLIKGNWCLGQGFYYKNLCFINQINGGDEWLTIKDDYDFESITFARIIKDGEFIPLLNRLLNATKEQCLKCEY